MLLTLAVTAGLCIWLILWSIGAKSFDAFLLTILIALVAATVRIAIPSRRDSRS